jgi:MoaA/NifB/PqqE/SkfB family radical SAM enzyme
MIEMAVAKGCRTYLTTNGTVLTERNSLALLGAGMNHLAVSIDGLTSETFDSLRAGASFTRVSENVRRLSELISRMSSPMELAIAFTIQEANAAELDLLIPWMTSVGARVLHLKQLNVISNRDDWQRSFLRYRLPPVTAGERHLEALEARILQVIEKGRQEGVQVYMHSELPLSKAMTARHCIAAPLESAYFSYEGRVAACCHLGHHVSRYMDGSYFPPSALFFGDIRQQEFPEIWNSPEFKAFRRGFLDRKYPDACKTCYLLYGK